MCVYIYIYCIYTVDSVDFFVKRIIVTLKTSFVSFCHIQFPGRLTHTLNCLNVFYVNRGGDRKSCTQGRIKMSHRGHFNELSQLKFCFQSMNAKIQIEMTHHI